MSTVQRDSSKISLFSFHLISMFMQKCRTIEPSDYRSAPLYVGDVKIDMQITVLLTRSQCRIFDTQVTVKARWPLV